MSAITGDQGSLPDANLAPRARQAPAQRGRLAGLIVGLGFVLFCLFCAGTAYGAYYYTGHAPVTHGASLELSHGGTVEINRSGTTNWVVSKVVGCVKSVATGQSCKEALNEGDSVRTGADTDALITLFDGSTIALNYGSAIKIQHMRSSRFFNQFKDLALQLESGSILVATPDASSFGSNPVQIATLAETIVQVQESAVARVALLDTSAACGSLALPCTQAIARKGRAHILYGAADSRDIVPQQDYSQMFRVGADNTPRGPERAEEELISNGQFVSETTNPNVELAAGWRIGRLTPPPPNPGDLQRLEEGSGQEATRAARFVRPSDSYTATNTPPEGVDHLNLSQDLNKQVSFYRALDLSFEVKIVAQDEAVDANEGQVYPLTVRINYTDAEGTAQTWSHRFYYRPLPGLTAAPDALAVVRGASTAESFSLLDNITQIVTINSLEFDATGHVYDVWVTNVSLVGR